MAFPQQPNCLSCNKPLKGRADKKFCDDYCRNAYNNQLKAKEGQAFYIRTINRTLLKNRKILGSLLPETEETAKTTKERLSQLGFSFTYITHFYTTRTGRLYYYCYDYGYLPLDNDWLLLVKNKSLKSE